MSAPLLRALGLQKTYPSGFSLDVPEMSLYAGRVYAIMGPNGAGKTTLLHLLALLEKPDQGRIFLGKEEVSVDSRRALAARRRMSLVMQTPVMLRTSVYGNVAYGLRLRRVPRPEERRRVEQVLQQVQLLDHQRQPAWQLSGGEIQRAALARALVLEPEVLFLDEPTANVDSAHVGVVENLIHNSPTRQSQLVLLTTHDPQQAQRVADEVWYLEGGRFKSFPDNAPFR